MEIRNQRIRFFGSGTTYFGILALNILLTILTLGLYYPWAKAKNLSYLYSETEFAGSRFEFHGTGKEMFIGFIKAIAFVGGLALIFNLGQLSGSSMIFLVCALVYFAGLLILIPLAIHGGLRYRMSRTSWRGIHFGYRGNLGELLRIYVKGVFLTIITLGIYGSWLSINLRKYIIGHLRMGNVTFSYNGDGTSFFWLNFKGVFLTIITLGIYFFWYVKDLNHYFFNNLEVQQNGETTAMRSHLTAGDVFLTALVNYFLVIFTFGLGAPWAILRATRMVFDNLELEGPFDPEAIAQTEEEFKDASGEDMLDMLDIGLDF